MVTHPNASVPPFRSFALPPRSDRQQVLISEASEGEHLAQMTFTVH